VTWGYRLGISPNQQPGVSSVGLFFFTQPFAASSDIYSVSTQQNAVRIILCEDNLDEEQAIQRMKKGDIAGLEFLVHHYQLKAVRTAYLITRDSQLAEDVVQDAFIHAFRAIKSFDVSRPFEPWFMRSVVNAALKAAQHAARQVPASSLLGIESEEGEALFETLLGRGDSIEDEIQSAAFQKEIRAALDQLSPRQRTVIVQRHFLEMSEKEMAEQAGTAPGTIKWLLNAARTRLRALLSGRSAE
jgi:RNA polymerase sigma-70 factor, ECF subfamily